jgi:carbonic anhydrase
MRIVRRIATSLVFVFVAACATIQPVPPTADPGLAAWNSLVLGNRAFQTGTVTFSGLNRRLETQNPPITMLACSDSRVPPEIVFQQTLGRLFIVRSAGNVADPFGIASIEYAIDKGYTKLLIILAHEKCGAVEAAIPGEPQPGEPTPSLNALIMKIRESFKDPDCQMSDPDCWKRRTRENAEFAITDLKQRSPMIRKAIDDDRLPVVVVYYDLNRQITVWQAINIDIPTPSNE